jgi:hypothetical protein
MTTSSRLMRHGPAYFIGQGPVLKVNGKRPFLGPFNQFVEVLNNLANMFFNACLTVIPSLSSKSKP